MSKANWETLYSRGAHVNRFPYTEVVSAFSRYLQTWEGTRTPVVLEVGCGAGNNLRALKDLGFEVAGIEISEAAAELARQFVGGAKIVSGSMTSLPWETNSFDFVLDRAAVTHVPAVELPRVAEEIERVLVPGGRFQSEMLFGTGHPGRDSGSLQPSGSYDFFESGAFVDVGTTSFFDEEELRRIFSAFGSLEIRRKVVELNQRVETEWFSLVGVKNT